MSKHRLNLDDEFEFLAFGLSCHLKDYRVAWMLNKALHREFVRQTVPIHTKSGIEPFAKFVSRDEDNRLSYVLLSNHNEETILLKRLKQYDLFVLVEGYIDIFDSDTFLHTIQEIETIQYVSSLDAAEFEDIQYILFEE